MADVRGDEEPLMADSPANSLATVSGEFNREATKTIMDLPCELHDKILMHLAMLDYYSLYDLEGTSKYFQSLCQNFIERNPEHNYSAVFESQNELVCAARSGLLDRVKFYLEKEKVDVDSADKTGFTALHEASGLGKAEIVNYLISKRANVDTTGNRRSDPRLRSHTPLLRAIWYGRVEIAKILIQNGAKTDVITEDRNLLDKAIISNNPEMISLVVSHGLDINRHNDFGMTPLAYAMSLTAYESVKFLLENGADYKKTSGSERFLPIHYGMWDIRCAELLLNHIEQKEGRKGVVDYINSNDNSEGFTTLHRACRPRDFDAVKLYLERGADPDIRDKKGKKPYDYLPEFRVDPVCEQVKALFISDNQHQDCTLESPG